ncbi:type 3 dihydrofolate reductase [Agarivorans sp. B2Z047]|uniref:type 3 dihydrofolate reductase n=1 Tax=Agarivorans sp. B2Z047 TaxID=2652721 RepID=UPI001406B428|nr:type 3 dihydrofolate reductase [Agarivorans sp. B2Z047]MPW31399.1 type 3 dihydrofolate reductase [Agarivorans sp. B2Z047]UQN42443.1 type 3 dihydrofolate reductase [Agarivorans sp. B2Z047]
MKVAMIAAMAKQRVIGKDNQMPWHLPADLKHFKAVTMGKSVIMGRLTYQSIGRPLPGRLNIVVSRNVDLVIEGVTVVNTVQAALDLVKDEAEVMVIGGGNIYQQCLAFADTLYLTFIEKEVEGDAHFPDYQKYQWQQLASEKHLADEKNPYNYEFVTLERV